MQRKVIGSTVDTVGRGVIVPNPRLKLNEVGLPTPMAFGIMAPFVERELVKAGYTPVDAMKQVKQQTPQALEVLQNILENALKYGDGKRIAIHFANEEDCRLVTVENTGCTLPERELPNIFDSFYRGSNSEKQKGSGLGLYICRQIMRAMDGEVYAEVKKSGKEDIFAVTAVFRKK